MAMPVPGTAAGAAGLAAILTGPRDALLAFDFDGVLSPIVANPDEAQPHPGAIAALARLAPLVGSLAIVTGRPAAFVVRRGRLTDLPALTDLVVFGGYGRERWDAGTAQIVAPPPPPGVAAARAELPSLLDRVEAQSAWLEDKGGAVAVHTRRATDPHGLWLRLREPVAELAARHGLVVEPGRLVLELRPPGVDKGATLKAYVAERSARAVAYTGDDLGDLSAFAAVEELRAEGVAGLKIGSGSPEVAEVAARADLVVDGPDGVIAFLDALAASLPNGQVRAQPD